MGNKQHKQTLINKSQSDLYSQCIEYPYTLKSLPSQGEYVYHTHDEINTPKNFNSNQNEDDFPSQKSLTFIDAQNNSTDDSTDTDYNPSFHREKTNITQQQQETSVQDFDQFFELEDRVDKYQNEYHRSIVRVKKKVITKQDSFNLISKKIKKLKTLRNRRLSKKDTMKTLTQEELVKVSNFEEVSESVEEEERRLKLEKSFHRLQRFSIQNDIDYQLVTSNYYCK